MYGLEEMIVTDSNVKSIVQGYEDAFKTRNYRDLENLNIAGTKFELAGQSSYSYSNWYALRAMHYLYAILIKDDPNAYLPYYICVARSKGLVHERLIQGKAAELNCKYSRGLEARMRGIYKVMHRDFHHSDGYYAKLAEFRKAAEKALT